MEKVTKIQIEKVELVSVPCTVIPILLWLKDNKITTHTKFCYRQKINQTIPITKRGFKGRKQTSFKTQSVSFAHGSLCYKDVLPDDVMESYKEFDPKNINYQSLFVRFCAFNDIHVIEKVENKSEWRDYYKIKEDGQKDI